MEFFLKYIKSHLVIISIFLISVSIPAAVMFLYGTPAAVIVYSVVLCLVAGLSCGGLCMYYGWKKDKRLKLMRKLPADITDA
ncbi:MAG: hypothetical protein MR328_04925, partial [Firmicutes bacterium]|nr:hypothetical protein [Bacillota bacterium]